MRFIPGLILHKQANKKVNRLRSSAFPNVMNRTVMMSRSERDLIGRIIQEVSQLENYVVKPDSK